MFMRYYTPSTGRWISRDPLEENGGMNVYSFVSNMPLGKNDCLGLDEGGGEADVELNEDGF
jgi:RHS repeat-associated protein